MKGFIRRRGEAWELRVYAGVDPVTGKKRYVSRTVHGGKRDAQRELAAMVVAVERGITARTSATVGQLLEAWFEVAKEDFTPKTVKETRGMLDRYLVPALGHVSLNKLAAGDLDRFYRNLVARGGVGGARLAPGTVRRIHGVLHRALEQGVKWAWLGSNPASAATPPRVPRSDVRPPSPAVLVRILEDAFDLTPELGCFLILAAATGARRSELVALRWSDVDLAGRTLDIRRGIVAGPSGLVEKDTKTHAVRRVSVDQQTVDVLAAQRDLVLERVKVCRARLGPKAFVFSSSVDGTTPWYPDSVTRTFKRLCRARGVEDVRLHDLRHFVATQLLGAGVDVRTVAGRLGHRNAATTLNVYAHFLQQQDRAAADLMGELIARRAPSPRPPRPANEAPFELGPDDEST